MTFACNLRFSVFNYSLMHRQGFAIFLPNAYVGWIIACTSTQRRRWVDLVCDGIYTIAATVVYEKFDRDLLYSFDLKYGNHMNTQAPTLREHTNIRNTCTLRFLGDCNMLWGYFFVLCLPLCPRPQVKLASNLKPVGPRQFFKLWKSWMNPSLNT